MTKNYKEFELKKEQLQKDIQQEIRDIEFIINSRISNSYDIDKMEAILCELKLLRINKIQ